MKKFDDYFKLNADLENKPFKNRTNRNLAFCDGKAPFLKNAIVLG